jgi:signal transduction histidine kinase
MGKDILIPFATPSEALGVVAFCCLLLAIPAWLGYWYGCRRAPLWRRAMSHLPVGVTIFNQGVQREPLFKNDLAMAFEILLGPGSLDRVLSECERDPHYTAVLDFRNRETLKVQVHPLKGYKRGRVLTLWPQEDGELWREAMTRLPIGVMVFNNGTLNQPFFKNDRANGLLEQIEQDAFERILQECRQAPQYAALIGRRDEGTVSVHACALDQHNRGLVLTLRNKEPDRLSHLGHEFLTPLSTIQLNLELANTEDEAIRTHNLGVARNEVQRLMRLVDDLLLLSHIDAGLPVQRQITEIADVILEAMDQLKEKARSRGVTLEIKPADIPAPIAIVPDEWKRVFLNLIGNAIKYHDKHGFVRVMIETDVSMLSIKVIDNGPGIPADETELVFRERFRGEARRRDVEGGSGLGLAITRKIVERHGGAIKCTETAGGGATFTISLPLE